MPLMSMFMICAVKELGPNTQAERSYRTFWHKFWLNNDGNSSTQRILGASNDGLQDQQKPQGPLCLSCVRTHSADRRSEMERLSVFCMITVMRIF